MDGWLIIVVVTTALLVAASAVRTIMGTALRYVLFVVFTAMIYQKQLGADGFDWLSIQTGQQIAIAAAISLLITSIAILGFFRKSRLKIVLWPILGFAISFGVTAVWTQQI